MAASPPYKVYNKEGKYEGCTKTPDCAAALVSVLGENSTVRYNHRNILWTEGENGVFASESYDVAAHTMLERLETLQQRSYKQAYKLG